jgi:serine/threonine-protein kinase
MRAQIMFDVPAGLSVDEVKQVFRCLSEEPRRRPPARRLRFFNPSSLTTSQMQMPRARIAPGPPLGRSVTQSFTPGAQALLLTFASNQGELAGQLFSLDKPELLIGRRSSTDICIPEPTVSGHHAKLRWQQGSWVAEDLGSTNGTYADHSYDRKETVTLLHGGEAQFGECRLKLVSFEADSAQHKRAQEYLHERDGLTGLYARQEMLAAVEDELKFCEWNNVPLSVARYEVRGPTRTVSERPTILEMLALRRAAQRVIELTEMLLLSIVPVTAGRTGPLRFLVAMNGPGTEEARQVVEQVVSQVQGSMPPSLELFAELVLVEAGTTAEKIINA